MTSQSKRGFSLTEMAIVLGVAGALMGGVWVAASDARSNVKQSHFTELLSSIVENVRGVYGGKASFESTSVATMMPKLRAMNVFLGDAVRKNADNTLDVVSPFGGLVYVCGWKATGSTQCKTTGTGTTNVPFFAVEVLLGKKDCVNAVMRNSNPSFLPGLIGVSVNGHALSALPASLSSAQSSCGAAENTVDFVFRLVL